MLDDEDTKNEQDLQVITLKEFVIQWREPKIKQIAYNVECNEVNSLGNKILAQMDQTQSQKI